MKLVSWNVNGIRAVYKKGLQSFVAAEEPDIICLQEIKIQEEQFVAQKLALDGYSSFFSAAEKPGYSGVATFIHERVAGSYKTATVGLGHKPYDSEGRCLITEHEDFVLYNMYFPSGTTGEVRQSFKYEFLAFFLDHLRNLPEAILKRLIICGDFNICHRAVDIHHPVVAEKRMLTGFLPEERAWMDSFVELGFVDTFRAVHGDTANKYTWWTYRAGAREKNLGWRLDYFFVAEALRRKIATADIYSHVDGSDHCPVLLEFDADRV